MAAVIAALSAIALGSGPAAAAPQSANAASPADVSHACPAPPNGFARCGAIQLLHPSRNWHPTRRPTSSASPSGYYPIDLQSAYGLGTAVSNAAKASPSSRPTIAVVDAYDDPNAGADLNTYRSTMSGAKSGATGLTDKTMPLLCGYPGAGSNCITFKKVDQTGGSNYPHANKGWAEEISLDLDMASAVCPYCNITLVEASSSSFSNLEAAVTYAKGLPGVAAVTNSYGGGEFSQETGANSVYANTTSTGVTVATGDSGYGAEFPAAAPDTTAVGGTSLTYSGGKWSQTVWSGSGAGCSKYESQPGRQSIYSNPNICSMRQIGDVAAVADPYTGVAVYDTYNDNGWMVFGGTSASTQIIGGMYGLAAFGSQQSDTLDALYNSASGNLIPVTSGSDGSCGNYLCNASDSISGIYNGPTGLGTPYGIGAFTGATPAAGFTVSATPTTASITAGQTQVYNVSVSSTGGYQGQVNLGDTGCPSGATCVLSTTSVNINSTTSGSATLTVSNTGSVSSNTYQIQITGTDNAGVASPSSTTVSLTVGSGSSGGGGGSTGGTLGVSISEGTVSKKGPNFHVPLTVTTDDSSGNPLSGATVTLDIYQGATCSGTVAATGSATTGSNGQVNFQFTTKQTGSWCALATASDSSGDSGTSNPFGFTTP